MCLVVSYGNLTMVYFPKEKEKKQNNLRSISVHNHNNIAAYIGSQATV